MRKVIFVFFISFLLGSQLYKLTPAYEVLKILEDDDVNELDSFLLKYEFPDSVLISSQDGGVLTLFMAAQLLCKFKHSERLIELKADVDFVPWIDEGCPLNSSIINQPEISIRFLLENSATIYAPVPLDGKGSIFSTMLEFKLPSILIQEFLRLGTDPNYITLPQKIPECVAVASKHSDECLDLLIHHGADINCFSNYTVLHHVVFDAPERAIMSLFTRGLRADIRGKNGTLPIRFLTEQRKQLENKELIRKAFLTAPFRAILKSINALVKYQTLKKTLIMQYFNIFFVTNVRRRSPRSK